MKPRIFLSLVMLYICGTTLVLSGEAPPDPKLKALTEEYEQKKRGLLIRLNSTYIKKLEVRLKEAMREGDLPAANQADRQIKQLIGENELLIVNQQSADLIASLAGEWELVTTLWGFRISADGRVVAVPDENQEGRIEVINLEKRLVRMTGFPMTMTWEVTEGSRSLHGTQHPARRRADDKR